MTAAQSSPVKYFTQEHKNRHNVDILEEKSQQCLLNVFHKHFPRNPVDLYNALLLHKRKLKQLLNQRILKQDQYDVIYPACQRTDSSLFDVTLTFFMIRTLCGYQKPRTGWDSEPDPTDTSDIAYCIILKIERNQLNHKANRQITKAEYKRIYNRMSKPLIALGCPPQDLKPLSPTFIYQLPIENPNFVGRENELNKIHQSLVTGNKLATVISGIPGLGKSELARRYVTDYAARYNNILWINAETIETTYTNIAQILSFPGQSNIKDISHMLHDYFKNEETLFVFDNCTDINQLSDVLKLGQKTIITTQLGNWTNNYEHLKMETWPEQTAYKFVENNLKDEKHLFKDLIEELDFHPLAISHAVAYVKQSQTSLKDYLQLLRDYKLDTLSQKAVTHYGVRSSVFSSFQITIKRIEQSNDQSMMSFLYLFGILDGSFIDERFLERCFENKLEYTKAKKLLLDYSMIKCNQRFQELTHLAPENFWTVHSLYQISIQHYLAEKNIEFEAIKKFYETIDCIYDEDSNKLAILWTHHLYHLWKEPKYKTIFIDIIDCGIWVIYLDLDRTGYDNFSKQIVKESYEVRSHNKTDITVYWIKHCMIGRVTKENLRKLLKEVKTNVVEESPEKELLIQKIQKDLEDNDYNDYSEITAILIDGDFEGHQSQETLNFEETFPLALSYKELGNYNAGLQLIKKYSDFKYVWYPCKTLIACLLILNGMVEEGLEIFDSLTFDADQESSEERISLSEVGRALFDTGAYEKCGEIYQRFHQFALWLPFFSYLDSFCKMLILKKVETIDFIKGQLLFFIDPRYKLENSNPTRVEFRCRILYICCFIRENDFKEASKHLKKLFKKLKRPNHPNDLREALFMAKHLKLRQEHEQALTILFIVKKLQKKINAETLKLNGVEIDIDRDIEFCINRLGGLPEHLREKETRDCIVL
eukprot:TCONS_00012206-protein